MPAGSVATQQLPKHFRRRRNLFHHRPCRREVARTPRGLVCQVGDCPKVSMRSCTHSVFHCGYLHQFAGRACQNNRQLILRSERFQRPFRKLIDPSGVISRSVPQHDPHDCADHRHVEAVYRHEVHVAPTFKGAVRLLPFIADNVADLPLVECHRGLTRQEWSHLGRLFLPAFGGRLRRRLFRESQAEVGGQLVDAPRPHFRPVQKSGDSRLRNAGFLCENIRRFSRFGNRLPELVANAHRKIRLYIMR